MLDPLNTLQIWLKCYSSINNKTKQQEFINNSIPLLEQHCSEQRSYMLTD